MNIDKEKSVLSQKRKDFMASNSYNCKEDIGFLSYNNN